MTHKDIYEKFMIEYDKANITSSYPSLTEYEIATILDKAYLALIAQKLTGNNQRKAGFEFDVKAIEDLRPLIINKTLNKESTDYSYSNNDYVYTIPDDLLYHVTSKFLRFRNNGTSIDDQPHSIETVKLIDHNYADKYMATDSNLPWINIPMMFMENKHSHVLVDSYKVKKDNDNKLRMTYICKPNKFVDNLVKDDSTQQPAPQNPTIPQQPVTHNIDPIQGPSTVIGSCIFTTSAYNSNGIQETIIWTIVEGTQYATLDSYGKLIAKPSANDSRVVIQATNMSDPTKMQQKTIYVTYNSNTEEEKPDLPDTPNTPIYTIGNSIQGPSVIDNDNNKAQYIIKTNGTPIWSIEGGSEIATIDQTGTVRVIGGSVNIVKVIVKIKEDTTLTKQLNVTCIYHSNSVNTETNPLIGKIYGVDEYTPWSPLGDLHVWVDYAPSSKNYRFATKNLGAIKSSDFGNTYRWGETTSTSTEKPFYTYSLIKDLDKYKFELLPTETDVKVTYPSSNHSLFDYVYDAHRTNGDTTSDPTILLNFDYKYDAAKLSDHNLELPQEMHMGDVAKITQRTTFNGVNGIVCNNAFFPIDDKVYKEYSLILNSTCVSDTCNINFGKFDHSRGYLTKGSIKSERPLTGMGSVDQDEQTDNFMWNRVYLNKYSDKMWSYVPECKFWLNYIRPIWTGQLDAEYRGKEKTIKNVKCVVIDTSDPKQSLVSPTNPIKQKEYDKWIFNRGGFTLTLEKTGTNGCAQCVDTVGNIPYLTLPRGIKYTLEYENKNVSILDVMDRTQNRMSFDGQHTIYYQNGESNMNGYYLSMVANSDRKFEKNEIHFGVYKLSGIIGDSQYGTTTGSALSSLLKIYIYYTDFGDNQGSIGDPNDPTNQELIDLGLPSGTLWAANDYHDFCTGDYQLNSLIGKYYDTPTLLQWYELFDSNYVTFEEDKFGIKIISKKNGNFIVIRKNLYLNEEENRWERKNGLGSHCIYWVKERNKYSQLIIVQCLAGGNDYAAFVEPQAVKSPFYASLRPVYNKRLEETANDPYFKYCIDFGGDFYVVDLLFALNKDDNLFYQFGSTSPYDGNNLSFNSDELSYWNENTKQYLLKPKYDVVSKRLGNKYRQIGINEMNYIQNNSTCYVDSYLGYLDIKSKINLNSSMRLYLKGRYDGTYKGFETRVFAGFDSRRDPKDVYYTHFQKEIVQSPNDVLYDENSTWRYSYNTSIDLDNAIMQVIAIREKESSYVPVDSEYYNKAYEFGIIDRIPNK